MEKKQPLTACLGLDIGRINTRAAYFGIQDEKYHLLGCELALTSLVQGLHLGAGEAMQSLQSFTEHTILNSAGGLVMPADASGQGIDQVAIVISAGPEIQTALLGLAEGGSLLAGKALLDSLPIKPVAMLGMSSLIDESGVINTLLKEKPALIVITGGENNGAVAKVQQWVEVARMVCRLLPAVFKPTVIFAGNPQVEEYARRRLEPVTHLLLVSNIQPDSGKVDLSPALVMLEREILKIWQSRLPGLAELCKLSRGLEGIKSYALGRMVRYLGRVQPHHLTTSREKGVLAIDLGGGSATVAASLADELGIAVLDTWHDDLTIMDESFLSAVHRWTAVPVSRQVVQQYLINLALHPSLVPETLTDLAISQALARYHLAAAAAKLSSRHPWFGYTGDQGLNTQYEPMILSGAVFTQSPTQGEAMLILLDSLQPWGITTLVMDRGQILPVLGVIGVEDPILSVQVLESTAFEHLGTVIAAVSSVPAGAVLLTVRVIIDSGKQYAVDIIQGTLRRLVIPPGVTAVLDIQPARHTDVGFGGKGVGGKLKVKGGALGVVVDARGRPIQLPERDADRIEQLRQWLWNLGG